MKTNLAYQEEFVLKEPTIEVEVSAFEAKGVDIEARTIEGMISTIYMDRDGEIVLPEAFEKDLEYYKSNPILILSHIHKSLPVGKMIDIKVIPNKGLWAKFYLSENSIGSEVLTLVKEGCLRGFSSGFVPLEVVESPSIQVIPPIALKNAGMRKPKKLYKRVELVEVSLLAIPSNRESLIGLYEKGNKVAGLVVKSFDAKTQEEIDIVLKEWIAEQKDITININIGSDDKEIDLPITEGPEEEINPKSLWLGFIPDNKLADDLVEAQAKLGLENRVEKEDLHMTLKWFGDVESDEEVNKVAAFLSNELGPLLKEDFRVVPEGYDVFGSEKAFVAKYISPEITNIREIISNKMKNEGFDYPDTYPEYKPHITLAEGFESEPPKLMPPSGSVKRLLLKHGDLVIRDYGPTIYTLKSLLGFWQEDEHPRDNDGRFSHKDERREYEVMTSHLPKQNNPLSSTHPDIRFMGTSDEKLDRLIAENQQIRSDLQEVKDKDSWGNWFKKWGIRLAVATAAYYGFKKYRQTQHWKEVKTSIGDKVRDWLVGKSYDGDVNSFLLALDSIKLALDKGRSLGMEKDPEFLRLQTLYDDAVAKLREEFETQKNLSDLLVKKEMTPEEFKEEEHPRHTDGKFRKKSEGSGYQKVKAEEIPSYIENHEEVSNLKSVKERLVNAFGSAGRTFYEWAKNHKGTLLVSTAWIPICFTNTKIVTRLNRILKGAKNQRVVDWKDVVKAGKQKEFYDQMKAGDIFLSGTMPHENVKQIYDEAKILLNKKVMGGPTHGTELAWAKENLMELASKVATGGQYTHSFMIIGKLDEKTLERIKQSPNANEVLGRLCLDLRDEIKRKSFPGVKTLFCINPETGKKERLIKDQSVKGIKDLMGEGFDFKNVIFDDFIGSPLRLQGTKTGVMTLGVAVRPHSGTISPIPVTTGVARLNIPEEKMNNVIEGCWDDLLNMKETGIKHPWSQSTLVRPAASGGIFDPVTSRIVRAIYRNDGVTCSGVIASMFKRHGVDLGKDATTVSPMDFLKNRKLESFIVPKIEDKVVSIEKQTAKEARPKREILAPAIVAAKMSTIPVTAIGVQQYRKYKAEKKGRYDLIQKEMTAEEFVEAEHPRDKEGKFTDKYNQGATKLPEPTKGTWGGARASAGRLPLDAVKMKAVLEKKYLTENPDITQQEIDERTMKFAIENNKADLVHLMSDPVAYQEEQKRKILDAAASSYNRPVVNGKAVRPAQTSSEIDDVATSVAGSKAKWDRAVAESKSVHEAIATFKNKDASELERSNAKIIGTVAAVAALIGFAAVLRGRPNIIKASGLKVLPAGELRKNRFQAMRASTGRGYPLEVIEPKMLHVLDIVPDKLETMATPGGFDPMFQIRKSQVGAFKQVGFFSKWLGRIFVGENKALVLGAKWHGYKGASRFNVGEFSMIKNNQNFVPQAGDIGTYSGQILIKADGSPNPIGIAIEKGRIPDANEWKGESRPFGLTKTKIDGGWRWDYNGTEGERKFLDFLSKDWNGGQGLPSGKRIFNKLTKTSRKAKTKEEFVVLNAAGEPTKEVNPSKLPGANTNVAEYSPDVKLGDQKYQLIPGRIGTYISRQRPDTEIKLWNEAVEGYKGWSEFLDSTVFPGISRRVMAGLTVGTAGAGSTMYLFQRNIEESLGMIASRRKKEEEQTTSTVKAESDFMKGQKADQKQKLAELKAQIKLAEARGKAAEKKESLEWSRAHVIDELVKMGLKAEKEGATSNVTLSSETIMRKFHRKITSDDFITGALGYPNTREGKLKAERDLATPEGRARMQEAVMREFYRHADVPPPSKEPPDKKSEMKESNEPLSEPKGPSDEKTKGFYELILKGLEDSEEEKSQLPLDMIQDVAADEIIDMFTKTSKLCNEVVKSGMPGAEDWAAINQILTEMYGYMKDQARNEEPVTKGMEMSSQDDSSAGLLVPNGDRKVSVLEKCPKCGKMANEELISKCTDPECPYEWLSSIEKKE